MAGGKSRRSGNPARTAASAAIATPSAVFWVTGLPRGIVTSIATPQVNATPAATRRIAASTRSRTASFSTRMVPRTSASPGT